ncbi:MAG: class I SAM-dependent methyltransferase [Thermomicrobiales bacterium]
MVTNAQLPPELRRHVEGAGPLVRERISLPGTSEVIEVWRPVDYDRLIDEAAADPEQNLPYWAELWPSGVALAAAVAREPAALRGKRVLEIGCGLGVTAIAALRAGADLLVTDYAPEALALCALNALDETGRLPKTLRLNWRDPGPAMARLVGDRFSVVLAADVLYESRDVEPLLELVERVVAPCAELWLAEPGRPAAACFLESISDGGWTVKSVSSAGPWPDPEDNRKGIVVAIHRLRRHNL